MLAIFALLWAANCIAAGVEVRQICTPDSPPLVITAPGTYDWSCGGSNVSENDSAIIVRADDVLLINPVAHHSRHCIRIIGADRVRVSGGQLMRCKKFAIHIEESSNDVTVEGVTIEDSGNGINAGTRGMASHHRLRIIGNSIRRIGGAVDGHGIGLQTIQDSVVAHNVIEQTQMASISVYWWNGATVQSGNRVEFNEINNPGGQGIFFGGSNGEGMGRYDNLIRNNTVRAREPMYLKGNLTPRPDQWAIEAVGNTVNGPIKIGRSGPSCGRVRLHENIGVTLLTGTCRALLDYQSRPRS